MKNLKQITQLMASANDLLVYAQQSQKKYESMCRYNVEIAAPNGLELKTDEEIEFQDKVTARIVSSYFRMLNEIKKYEI